MTRPTLQSAGLYLATAFLLAFTPQSKASIINFTAGGGSNGDLIDTATNKKVGVYIFNIFDGNPTAIGVDLFSSWDLAGEIIGFGVDFTGAFSTPRTIASAQFTNWNDLSNPSDDTPWPTTISGVTTSASSTGPGDTVATGEWWDDQTRFTTSTQGSLGFTGYFVVQDSATAPEPSTWLLLGTSLCLIARIRPRSPKNPA